MKLLIASWGNFENWREVKYRFGDETSVGPSTLPILQKAIEPDWTVIVLPETLGRDFSSLEALREELTVRVQAFLERIGVGREVDVLLVPGIGKFEHGTFEGSAMDVYYKALHGLSQVIPTDGDLEVHFDITHGLNYVTFLVHRALRELLGIRALTSETIFKAYNSDPFVPKLSSELGINVIEDVRVEPHPLTEGLLGLSEYLVPYSIEKRALEELKRELKAFGLIKSEKRKLEAWIGAIVFGLPLLFAEDFPETEPIGETVDELMETWESHVEVSDKSVKRRLAFGRGFGVLVKLVFQARVLEKFKLDIPPSLDDLYKVSEMLFWGANRDRAKVELGKIEGKAIAYARAKCFPDWMPLRDFSGFTNANTAIVPRNLLAHAGLEANATEVRMEDWNVKDAQREARKHTFLRYSSKVKRRVEEITVKALGGA
ncbi:CRISPR-associated CARF protein Csx1 [Thermococcus sp.]|uniref:CRISPR-associated CARF protein Csx1 n=1 Tax=Thermococcus sp. TaxID=35749 RepID=UPI00261BD569|nr:CRISPR-associated CARF protein Csx1 [Thermococcus sp.]